MEIWKTFVIIGIMLALGIGLVSYADAMDRYQNNPARPDWCNTSRLSDCYKSTYSDSCDLPFAPIIWSDC